MSGKIICGKGVNKDLLPSELEPGYWSDCMNFRTRNGFEEKFEGVIVKDTGATIAYDGVGFLYPYLGTQRVAVYHNSAKVYSLASGIHREITRYRNAQTITSITRIGANTAELTTAGVHGLTTGDKVTVFGATETGYNEVAATVTVMSTTVFRYTTTNVIGANATVVGTYIVYESAATSDFSGLDIATGGVLNGVFFLFSPSTSEGLYYWGGGITTKLRKVTYTVPDLTNIIAARPFKNHLVLLGIRDVYWTDSADPGAFPTTFTASTTNDAGTVSIAETNGYLIDCLPLGDVNIIYKQDSRYAMQYIGGEEVFSFTRLPGNDGVYLKNCVVNTPKGHVFLTNDLDIKVHQGGEATSIADGRVKKYFASAFNANAFLCVNPEKSEVWVCFSTTAATIGYDRALVWNWESDTWGIFDLTTPVGTSSTEGIVFAASGLWYSSLTDKPRLFIIDKNYDFKLVDSAAVSGLTGTLERTGMDFADADVIKNLQRSRWNFDGTPANTATIYHGSSMTADGTTSWTAGTSYTIGTTDYANARATGGRFVGVKLSTTANSLALRSFDLDITPGGKR